MLPQTPAVVPPTVGPEPAGLDAATKRIFSGGTAAPPPITDPYADDAALLKTFQEQTRRCQDRRQALERIWWRVLLYLLGRMWIYYDRQSGAYLDKRLQKWIPRPVTNKIAETLNTIMSVFESVELSVSCRAQGGTPQDIMAADTANKYEAPIRDDHEMDDIEDESDFWLTALGNVGWYVWWDYSGDGPISFVQWEQCAACGQTYSPLQIQQAQNMCPGCGNQILKPATTPDGRPLGVQLQKGHGCTDVVSPLEYAVPPDFKNHNKSDVVIRWRWRSKPYLENRLAPEMLRKIQWEKSAENRSLQMLRALATATELTGAPSFGAGGEPTENEGVTEAECWLKPCKQYPEGLVLRVISATSDGGGIVMRAPEEAIPGPIPFVTNEGRRVWPWIFTGYEKFGGRGWSRSPLETLLNKNDQLNQIDSLMLMSAQRMSNPVWLEPIGSNVSKYTGEPGVVIKYNALGGNGAKPERIEGQNIPASLPAMREQILSDIEQLAGTFDVMKGQKPAGVEAFSAMQLLVERSQSRYAKVLKARGVTYRKWYKIALDMERTYGPDDRAYAILGPNGGWSFMAFKKTNLDGSIRVEVEDGSQMPKTSLGTRAAIQQLQALTVINTQNPDTQYAILQKFGQTALYPGLDAQVMAARRIEQQFEAWASAVEFTPMPAQAAAGPTGALITDPATGQPVMAPAMPMPSVPPPDLQPKPWQKSDVFLAEFQKWACGDIVQELITRKPELEPYLVELLLSHEAIVAQQQAAAAALSAPAGKGPNGRDGKGVGGGRAMTNSNQESGKDGVHTGPANAA